MSVSNAPTFESLDAESCWYTSSEYLGQVRISRSSGQGQGHKSKKAFAGGLPSTERLSCYEISFISLTFVFYILHYGRLRVFIFVFFLSIFKSFCIRFYDIVLWRKLYTGVLSKMASGCVRRIKMFLGYTQ